MLSARFPDSWHSFWKIPTVQLNQTPSLSFYWCMMVPRGVRYNSNKKHHLSLPYELSQTPQCCTQSVDDPEEFQAYPPPLRKGIHQQATARFPSSCYIKRNFLKRWAVDVCAIFWTSQMFDSPGIWSSSHWILSLILLMLQLLLPM